ncbi:MAG: transposase [Acidobacteriota bacterium]
MRGGKREGAGRRKTGRCRDAPHRRRPELDFRHPVHVVLRLRVRIAHRDRDTYEITRKVLARFLGRDDFRIVHVSIQNTHIHLLVEAVNREALTRGMQGFGISFAYHYHQRGGGCGKVFTYRYHSTHIKTRRHARHALAYVLNNWRRHRVDWENGTESSWLLDPFSSAVSFTGWTRRFRPRPNYEPLPVSPPGTKLLRSGWEHYGRISPYEVPGPLA